MAYANTFRTCPCAAYDVGQGSQPRPLPIQQAVLLSKSTTSTNLVSAARLKNLPGPALFGNISASFRLPAVLTLLDSQCTGARLGHFKNFMAA